LAGFEDVIQRALDKQGASSAAIREQVYNSARSTLAGMLTSSDDLQPENIRDQQQRLEQAIADIEARHIARDPVIPEVAPEGGTPESEEAAPGYVAPPPVQVQPVFSGPDFSENEPPAARSIIMRRPFAVLLLATIVLVAVAMGTWWVYDQDLTQPAAMRDNSVPNPPQILAAESSPQDEPVLINGEWLNVFEPGDPRGLSTRPVTTAELGKDNDGEFVRLAGRANDHANDVILTVEPGIMEAMSGKTVTFELKTKSGDGADLQFVVTCQFNSSGDCGRKRFTAAKLTESFVFNVQIPKGAAADRNKSGSISLIADISGQGRPLDLYLFRINVQ